MKTMGKKGAAWTERALLYGSLAAMALAIAMAATTPAHAGSGQSSAEKLRRLDIMLMVTGLRCRTTSDNFMSDYGRFTRRHMSTLNQANGELRAELARSHGQRGADRALDRLGVTMANNYGQGHPWLSCGQLRQVTRNLAEVSGRDALVEAADQVLTVRRSSQFAYAKP